MRPLVLILAGLALIGWLAQTGAPGVVDPLNVQDNLASPAGHLNEAHTLGQTLLVHSPRLSAIQVCWIASDDFSFAPGSRVTFHLRSRVDDSADRVTVALPLDQVRHNQCSAFRFSPQSDSSGRAYYFFLDAASAESTRGWFSVWASADDVLPEERAYYDDIPADYDLVFRTYSAPDFFAAFDTFREIFARQLPILLIAALMCALPGLALLATAAGRPPTAINFHPNFGERKRIGNFPETFALIGGLGFAALSAASLALLWFQLSVAWIIGAIIIAGGMILAIVRGKIIIGVFDSDEKRTTKDEIRRPSFILRHSKSADRNLQTLAILAALALLALAVGLVQFAELPAPLWVDSYSHAADIQNLLTQGRVPLNKIYHFGFHGIVALLIQTSGISIPAAIILIGQLIVVQIGLSFFAFGKRWTGSDVVGLASAICVWFLAPTPMYFLTWGRYPLLLGVALLPIAFICAMDWIDAPRFDVRAFSLVVVTLAGLAFAHLRLLAFYVVFLAIYCAWQRAHARRLAWLVLIGAPIGILWLAMLLSQPDGARNLSAQIAFWSGIDLATAFEILQSHHGSIAWTLAALGLVVVFARRNARALIVVAWFGALLALAGLLTLIGAPLLEVPFVVLMGFFSAALLIGELAQVAFTQARRIGLLVGVCVSLLGAREMLTIVNPATILFTRADEKAMTWIAANTPEDARVRVNTFAWYPGVHVPSDGGAWIPYFTHRAIVMPNNAPDAQAYTHIYLGRRAGILRARDFADVARYEVVYEEAGVKIFRCRRITNE